MLQIDKKDISIAIIGEDREKMDITKIPEEGTLVDFREFPPYQTIFPAKIIKRFGNLMEYYQLWKYVKTKYIWINTGNILINPFIENEEHPSADMVLRVQGLGTTVHESYRNLYYDHDFRIMMVVLKKYYNEYYRYAMTNEDEILERWYIYAFGGLMKKEVFDEFCGWLFSVVNICTQIIEEKYSTFQNKIGEHMAAYLFTIWVCFHEERLGFIKSLIKEDFTIYEKEEKEDYFTEEELKDVTACKDKFIQFLEERKVEDAISAFLECKSKFKINDESKQQFHKLSEESMAAYNFMKDIAETYLKEKRHCKLTKLDQSQVWRTHTVKETVIPKKKDKPKILIFKWASIAHDIVVKEFQKMGFEVLEMKIPFKKFGHDEIFLEQVILYLEHNPVDIVYSTNYFSMIAEACYINDIPYIAWCYDSPTHLGFDCYLSYETTHVFLFDSSETEEAHRKGFKNVHYMALAVSPDYFEQYISKDATKYQADISFVGRMYGSEIPNVLNTLNDYQKAYINALVDNQIDVYGYDLLYKIINENFMKWLSNEEFNRILNSLSGDNGYEKKNKKINTKDIPSQGTMWIQLAKHITNRERLLLVSLLSKYHQFRQYSPHENKHLENVEYCGRVDYYTEAPSVFRHSKLNINATLRSIKNGVPLRCFDICACRGTLLTNYQRDFDEHFEDEKNLLFYTNAEEALEKANFYLAHDSLREKIAMNGYETVKKYYSYPVKVKEMFHLAELDYLLPDGI